MIEGSVEEKIIERAQRKLYLDAAVIQQGRLADQSKSLSKDEMLSMIRFGADAVFHTKGGGEPTDEDIEALLLRGEERTRADESKLKDLGVRDKHELAKLSALVGASSSISRMTRATAWPE